MVVRHLKSLFHAGGSISARFAKSLPPDVVIPMVIPMVNGFRMVFPWFSHGHLGAIGAKSHGFDHRIGLGENFNRKAPYLSINLMVKSMVSGEDFPNKTNPIGCLRL